MSRSSTTTDALSAIAEPRRRELLDVVAKNGETCDVSWLVGELGWSQPQVSKHLAVLREVGLISVVRKGRRRMYSVNGDELQPIYEWIKTYERFWDHQLDRIKDRAEKTDRRLKPKDTAPPSPTI